MLLKQIQEKLAERLATEGIDAEIVIVGNVLCIDTSFAKAEQVTRIFNKVFKDVMLEEGEGDV